MATHWNMKIKILTSEAICDTRSAVTQLTEITGLLCH